MMASVSALSMSANLKFESGLGNLNFKIDRAVAVAVCFFNFNKVFLSIFIISIAFKISAALSIELF
jgi:hypothetical protein